MNNGESAAAEVRDTAAHASADHGAARPEIERTTMSNDVLKALANPLRRRVLAELSRRGNARAADLAERLDIPANKLSFHLRVLAQARLIEEDPSLARDRRDRVWVPVRGGRSLGSPEDPVRDPALGQAVLDGVVADHHTLIERVRAWAMAYTTGEDPLIRGVLTDATLHLTRERFEELTDELDAVVERFTHDERGPDTLGWDVLVTGASEEI